MGQQLDQWRPFLQLCFSSFFDSLLFQLRPSCFECNSKTSFPRPQTLVNRSLKLRPDPQRIFEYFRVCMCTARHVRAFRREREKERVGVLRRLEIFHSFFRTTNGSHALTHWFLPSDSIKSWFIDGKIRFNSVPRVRLFYYEGGIDNNKNPKSFEFNLCPSWLLFPPLWSNEKSDEDRKKRRKKKKQENECVFRVGESAGATTTTRVD